MIDKTNFSKFKSYNQYIPQKKTEKSSFNKKLLPLAGSSIGVAAGYLATKNIKLNNRILNELLHLLSMAGGANIGSVVAGSIGKKPAEIKKKVHEGLFQIMNTTLPMLMVSGANAICDKKIGKTKPVIRVVSSLLAMIGGAMLATNITNMTKSDNEPKRKYTVKDSVANVDDLVATFSLGFEEQAGKLKLDTRLMPFIYAYCGMRAGAKE